MEMVIEVPVLDKKGLMDILKIVDDGLECKLRIRVENWKSTDDDEEEDF